MRMPATLIKAWRWVRQDVQDPDLSERQSPPLVEWLKEQEAASRFSVQHDRDYLENLMVYRDRVERDTDDGRTPD